MSDVTATQVKTLRDATGAGMMDAKKALVAAGGDAEKATQLLREKGLAGVAKRADRAAEQGVIANYQHFNGTVGVLVEVNTETDFVANTEQFQQLAKDLAVHIASMAPRYRSREDVPEDVLAKEREIYSAQAAELGKPDNVIPKIVDGKLEAFYRDVVLLDQVFVKDDSLTIGQLVDETAAKLGEKVAVRRFVRYKLGEELD
ncbi:MAG: translation elongation factor Ts [Actinomycetota bacterium]